MTWWQGDYDGVICDGAIRAGKTYAMCCGFFLWSMSQFENQVFGLCGKTVGALRRNIVIQLPKWLGRDFRVVEHRGDNKLTVRLGSRVNTYYLFGGQDESAYSFIQGITLAGVLLDEVALMPRSFVEQACARCSVAGSRLWFNCNPAGPEHWFYETWILEAQQRNCLRLPFTMEDNPSLTPAIRQRYQRQYSGVFYQRYILGQWVQAEGRVYDFFHADMVQPPPEEPMEEYCISCDYGTVNPTSMGLWGRKGAVWYRIREFYFDSRRQQRQMTDEEYARALEELAGGRKIRAVVIDPSAASFMEVLRRRGWPVKKANNDVLAGIRATADALKNGRIVLCQDCEDCLREIECYVWDLGADSKERVKKENDHAMDDMRYFVPTLLGEQRGGFGVGSVARKGR